MDADKQPARKSIRDKLILLGLAVLLVAPFAVFFAIWRQPPKVAKSGSDLSKYSSDEKSLVTQSLEDKDLDELARFKDLEDLELYSSRITDAGMPKIGACIKLKRLVLVAVDVSDKGLRQLAGLKDLEVLILIGSEGAGADGLKFLPTLPKLRQFELQQCAGTDDSLTSILAQCPALTHLRLQNIRGLTDAAAAHLANMKQLTRLNLDFCLHISDAGVGQLGALTNLESLSLHGLDNLTDEALPALAKLKDLKELNLPLKAKLSDQALKDLHAALPHCKINR